jgi:hypothetical protein
LLAFGHLVESLFVKFSRHQVLAVGAAIFNDFAGCFLCFAVKMNDPRDRFVEKIEIMANNEKGTAVRAKKRKKPVAGIGI